MNLSTPTPSAVQAHMVGDYWIFRDADRFVLFDAGLVGPDHLPAHAHADLLGLEASYGGRRLFVDTGVFNYQDDSMREYCRGSAAHNVLVVDDEDQCDMWSRFRMGYRGWPGKLETGRSNEFEWARACHNAYRRFGAGRVGRWLGCRPGGPWFCVDWAEGNNTHRLASYLHVAPHVDTHQIADDQVRLDVGGTGLLLRYLTPGQLIVTTDWYCPELGRREPATVLKWALTSPLPAVCGWCLAEARAEGVPSLHQTEDKIRVRWKEGKNSLELTVVEKLS